MSTVAGEICEGPAVVDPAGVVGLVDDILARAVGAQASDVHFEPTPDEMLVRFRLDGALTTIERVPREVAANVVSRLKVMGGLLTYRNDIPQEGRIDYAGADDATATDLRLAVFPTIHGQRAVVRLFFEDRDLTQLSRLGLPDTILTRLTAMAADPQGVLLATGPAGSGKSTTLGAIVRHILDTDPGKSVVTLEDPVEQVIAGATQVEISPHGAMTFPVALRSLLRQDPQVLMIGEIRDSETARIAVEAGLTGHLLLSTLHSGTPAAALLRLIEMGIEPYQITSSIRAVLNQRLVRRLCERCKQPDGPDGRMAAAGCDACFGTGFRGRILIAQLVELDASLRQAILDKADADRLSRLLDRGGATGLHEHGLQLAQRGVTTETEIRRVCGATGNGDT